MGVPIVSGNVSLYNETEGRPIQPTPMVGCVGVLEDIAVARGIDWNAGDDIYVLGESAPTLGGSEYLSLVHGSVSGSPPAIDFELERRLQQFLRALLVSGAVTGVHDLSNGGLAVALAEMALVTATGATVHLGTDDRRNDVRWFGESASRALVAAAPAFRSTIENVALSSGVAVVRIGTAGGDHLALGSAEPISLAELRAAHAGGLDQARSVVAHA
jgi:phosphoribosylformylglycinamidine synthase